MGKFTNLDRIKKQAELTETLANRVVGDIGEHCEARKTYRYYNLPTGTPKKTQIQADILRLRRELLALSKMLD
nr:MAG TPA: hypothetical protein [Bacteriophage sp.]